MLVPHEERVTPWKAVWWEDPRLSAVRIWQRLTPFGMFQRHEWESRDGSRWAERWITGGKSWAAGAAAGPETLPSETNLLLAAIKRIAEGHNDPRGLAIETLAAMQDAA